MKKIGIILLALILLLSGCQASSSETTGSVSSTAATSEAAAGFVFKFDGVTIAMHAATASILEKLGEPRQYFEAESCAFPGMEKTYAFASFSLYTYAFEGSDRVASVVLMDDSVSTPEGIYLNASLDDVVQAYGNNYTKSLNLYSYESGKMKLSFIIENDVVTSIEYVALSGS